jgi:protein disulfide-isomerase
MIKFQLVVLLSVIYTATFAQDDAFINSKNDNWLVNVEEAYELSKKTNKPILANFTGSDWCGWCKKLSAEVFDTDEFNEWAKDNVILLELDFPRRTKLPQQQEVQNRSLQQAFKVTGFPTIWMFDLNKSEEDKSFQLQAYGKTGYVRGGPEKYTKELDKMVAKKK